MYMCALSYAFQDIYTESLKTARDGLNDLTLALNSFLVSLPIESFYQTVQQQYTAVLTKNRLLSVTSYCLYFLLIVYFV